MTIQTQNLSDSTKLYFAITCPDKAMCGLLELKLDIASNNDKSIAMKDQRRIYSQCSVEGNRKYCPGKAKR